VGGERTHQLETLSDARGERPVRRGTWANGPGRAYDVFIERRTVLFEDDGRQGEGVRLGLEDGENRDGYGGLRSGMRQGAVRETATDSLFRCGLVRLCVRHIPRRTVRSLARCERTARHRAYLFTVLVLIVDLGQPDEPGRGPCQFRPGAKTTHFEWAFSRGSVERTFGSGMVWILDRSCLIRTSLPRMDAIQVQGLVLLSISLLVSLPVAAPFSPPTPAWTPQLFWV
jgi:hypothetical protein